MRNSTLKTHNAGWIKGAEKAIWQQHAGCALPFLQGRQVVAALATVCAPAYVLMVNGFWHAAQRKNLWKPDLPF
ncbi:TPA: hypothetical protein MH325_24790 [Klebsiella pneumoniae]|nr:hypothetical protein [Klebsiella pneumoniae]HBY1805140.1 hypothetical protein [Klebsiella pneumoniae]